MRYFTYALTLLLTALLILLAVHDRAYVPVLAPMAFLALLGTHDLLQHRHNLLRNYPLLARLRWVFETVRPELRQYLFESNTNGKPFSREQRTLVYERAKDMDDNHPFGTELDVYAAGYEWIAHSTAPRAPRRDACRITIGGPQCARPYEASVFNISAMSFGSLSPNAIRALNRGALIGGFAHDTGEGGVSEYHREHGGDLIWEIGSGYFGCRTPDGAFDPGRFAHTASLTQIRMIEIKLSQGAKPGHGGILPAAKVTPEIAVVRGVLMGHDCVSPPCHRAFRTPIELMRFVARLRELSGGKPVGFKLCIGDPVEFMAIAKAIRVTGILPDFIVIDGGEGGTGAAPLELSNHVGMPLREGLIFARNVLVGAGLREPIRLGAAGKIISGYGLAANMALGADWCNAGRGFMFALGCVQALTCHTDRCPTGVATQNRLRQRALVVPDKAQRVANFHRHTVEALNGIVAAAGLDHPNQLTPDHLYLRTRAHEILPASACYTFLAPGALLTDPAEPFRSWWQAADPDRFGPART